MLSSREPVERGCRKSSSVHGRLDVGRRNIRRACDEVEVEVAEGLVGPGNRTIRVAELYAPFERLRCGTVLADSEKIADMDESPELMRRIRVPYEKINVLLTLE